jgi:CheY-like chemotaxis protein
MNSYWHVYPREQIKPEFAGDGIYALAVPTGTGAAVRSFVGTNLRHHRIATLPEIQQDVGVLAYPYGLIFEGINRDSLNHLEEPEPLWEAAGFEVPCRNQQVISAARKLFLSQAAIPRGTDPLTFCLLQGLTHLLPSFRSFPRIPIASLGEPKHQPGILIVEDVEELRELFRILLQSMGYRNIHLAENGAAALPILETQGGAIDLILLNWEMPRMDGPALMRHLAQSYTHPVGVIMESGYPHNDFKREFFRLGTDSVVPIDYLVKPFLIEEFELEIRVAMEYVRRRKLRQA